MSRHHSNQTVSCWMHGPEIMVRTNSWLLWGKTAGRAGLQQIYMSWQPHPFNRKPGKLYWWVQIIPKLHTRGSDYTGPLSTLWVLPGLQMYWDSRAKVIEDHGTLKWKTTRCNHTKHAQRNTERYSNCPPEYQAGLEIAYLARHNCCYKKVKSAPNAGKQQGKNLRHSSPFQAAAALLKATY